MRRRLLFFLLFSSMCVVFASSKVAQPIVKVDQGLLEGRIIQTRNGRNISAFYGIPYAQPPVGELRFRGPLPAKSWSGIYLANKKTKMCPQITHGIIKGNEDCLYLNVFTPLIEFNAMITKVTSDNTLLPVMVWIHGGAFGMGSIKSFGPDYLLDKNIILVSMNYRLGIFGFMTTGDSVAPGNFGLKDQVLALKWAQKNIRAFGGDPNRVTIFGQSAGGASVNFHALSSASTGLFHQYIIQSGTAVSFWPYRNRNKYKPFINEVTKSVGCPVNTSEVLVKCLREKSVAELLNTTTYNLLDYPILPWVPTNELDSEDSFLTDNPKNLIAQNKMKDFPFMSGTVVDEGLIVTSIFYKKSTTAESILLHVNQSINSFCNYYLMPQDIPKFKNAIRYYYFNESFIFTNKTELLKNCTKLVSDVAFFYPEVTLLENVERVAKSPFYVYSFGYHGSVRSRSLEDIKENIGVAHGDELFYLFPKQSSRPRSEIDEHVIDIMIDLWTSFAIDGKPISTHMEVPNLWLPYKNNKNYLQIGNINNNTNPSVTLENKYFANRMNFWKDHFPII